MLRRSSKPQRPQNPSIRTEIRLNQDQASKLLTKLDLPSDTLKPAYSNSNAVWMSEKYVLRAHIVGPAGRLAHEAIVAERLPAEIGYPTIVATGWQGEHDWMVQARRPGTPLIEAWPDLNDEQRRQTIIELGKKLRLVHRVEAAGLTPPCQFGGAPVIPRPQRIGHAQKVFQRAGLDETLAREACYRLQSLAPAMDDDPPRLIHGDLNLGNVLWHPEGISLLDFEMSRREAADLDLYQFLRFCEDPAASAAPDLESACRAKHYEEAPSWLRTAYPELFAHPSLADRLELYDLLSIAVGFEHQDSGLWSHFEARLLESLGQHG